MCETSYENRPQGQWWHYQAKKKCNIMSRYQIQNIKSMVSSTRSGKNVIVGSFFLELWQHCYINKDNWVLYVSYELQLVALFDLNNMVWDEFILSHMCRCSAIVKWDQRVLCILSCLLLKQYFGIFVSHALMKCNS